MPAAYHFCRLRVTFSDRYPHDPPEIIFLPPAPEHLHIYSNGWICLDILYACRTGGWSPAMTVSSCCISLRSMLASATRKCGPVLPFMYILFCLWAWEKHMNEIATCRQRPPGDRDFCQNNRYRSPKQVSWLFDDPTV